MLRRYAARTLATVIVVPVSTFVLAIVVSISLVAVTIISVVIMSIVIMSIAIISVTVPSAAIVIKVAAAVIATVASLIVPITVSVPIAVAIAILPSSTFVDLRRRQCGTASHQCSSNKHYLQPIHKVLPFSHAFFL